MTFYLQMCVRGPQVRTDGKKGQDWGGQFCLISISDARIGRGDYTGSPVHISTHYVRIMRD